MTDTPYTEEEERLSREDAEALLARALASAHTAGGAPEGRTKDDVIDDLDALVRRLLATLDAERAAHEETRRGWDEHAAGRAAVEEALREELRAEWAGNDALQDALAAARSEVEALRRTLIRAGRAVGAGLSDDVSTGFLVDDDAVAREVEALRGERDRTAEWLRTNAAEVARLRAEVERLRERCAQHEEDARRVLSEACATDEVHCSCVPVLRAEVERLTGEVADLQEGRRALNRELGATRALCGHTERELDAAEARVSELEGRLRAHCVDLAPAVEAEIGRFLVDLLESTPNARNCIEFVVTDRDEPRAVVSVTRPDGKTPLALKAEADEARAVAERLVEELQDRLRDASVRQRDADGPDDEGAPCRACGHPEDWHHAGACIAYACPCRRALATHPPQQQTPDEDEEARHG